MSEAQVRRSLKVHEERLYKARKRVAYRHKKHIFYEQKSKRAAGERKALSSKWRKLEVQARNAVDREEAVISIRRHELRYYTSRKESRRDQCVRHARSFQGTTEKPSGSNSGPRITQWQKETARGASYLYKAPWCGVFVENMLRDAGVRDTSSRMASVGFIVDDAQAKRGCFRGWTTSRNSVLPGDLVVLFGRSTHVGMVVKVTPSGVYTIEGNTSGNTNGSQSNGGGVFYRFRPYNTVYGFALVDFPN